MRLSNLAYWRLVARLNALGDVGAAPANLFLNNPLQAGSSRLLTRLGTLLFDLTLGPSRQGEPAVRA